MRGTSLKMKVHVYRTIDISLMLNFVKEEVSLINMFCLYVGNFSCDDLCPDPEISGGWRLKKNVFRPLGPPFVQK